VPEGPSVFGQALETRFARSISLLTADWLRPSVSSAWVNDSAVAAR
jgi:hypothetical protein